MDTDVALQPADPPRRSSEVEAAHAGPRPAPAGTPAAPAHVLGGRGGGPRPGAPLGERPPAHAGPAPGRRAARPGPGPGRRPAARAGPRAARSPGGAGARAERGGASCPPPSRSRCRRRSPGRCRRASSPGWPARAVARIGRRFIVPAGEEGRVLRDLRAAGRLATFDVLGEAVVGERQAAAYAARYRDLVAALAGDADAGHDSPGGVRRLQVSLKLSALTPRFDPADPPGTLRRIREPLEAILDGARRAGVAVTWDVEQYALRDLTWWLFQEVFRPGGPFGDWDGAGIVAQAYLRDAPAFVDRGRGVRPPAGRALPGAAGQGGLLGLRDRRRRGEPLAGAGLRREVADGRRLRGPDPDAARRLAGRAHRRGQPQRAQPGPRRRRRRVAGAGARGGGVPDPLRHGPGHLRRPPGHGLGRPGLRAQRRPPGRDGLPGAPPAGEHVPGGLPAPEPDRPGRRAAAGPAGRRAAAGPAPDGPPPAAGAGVRPGGAGAPLPRPGAGALRGGPGPDAPRLGPGRAPAHRRGRGGDGRSAPGLAQPLPAGPGRSGGPGAGGGRGGGAAGDRRGQRRGAAWAALPVRDRARRLRRAADLLLAARDEVAAWEVHEAGKDRAGALADVDEAIDYLRYYADRGRAAAAGLPAAGGGGGHPALELPRGHPLRDDGRRPGHGQRRHPQVRRADAPGGPPAGGRLAPGRRPGGRRDPPSGRGGDGGAGPGREPGRGHGRLHRLARRRPAHRGHGRRRASHPGRASSTCWPRWGARTRSWSSPTPTPRRRPPPPSPPPSVTPVRSARPPRASSCSARSTSA